MKKESALMLVALLIYHISHTDNLCVSDFLSVDFLEKIHSNSIDVLWPFVISLCRDKKYIHITSTN